MYSPKENKENEGSKLSQNNKVSNPVLAGLKNILHAGIISAATLGGPISCNADKIENADSASELNYENDGSVFEGQRWSFDVVETAEVEFKLEGDQKYFIDYLKDHMAAAPDVDLTLERDLQNFADFFLGICKKLNPGVNFDDQDSLRGKTLTLPSLVNFTPVKEGFLRSRVGYSLLRKMSKLDGMNIRDTSLTEQIYAQASKNPVMPDSEYYECKELHRDCKESIAPDAQIVFEKFAKEFFERSKGWKIVYTDLMRSKNEEDDRSNGTKLGSTHVTARSVDLSVERYVTPEGEKIRRGGASPEQVKKIETVIRPLLDEILEEYFRRGEIFVFEEGSPPHHHLYIPKIAKPLEPQVIKLSYKNTKGTGKPVGSSPKTDKPKTDSGETEPLPPPNTGETGDTVVLKEVNMKVKSKEGVEYYTYTIPNWTLKRMLDLLCTSSDEGMINSLKRFNGKSNEEKFKPGEVITIPRSFLKKELRASELSVIKKSDLDIALGNGVDMDILYLYNESLNSENVKVPKALLKSQ